MEPDQINNRMDVTADNIQDAVQLSMEKPVILDIWANWCEPCKAQGVILDKLLMTYQGKILVAKLDTEKEQILGQQLMAQLGVRSIPVLVIFYQGRPVKVMTGLQDEQSLRDILDPLTISPAEKIRSQVDALVSAGQHQEALDRVHQLLVNEPGNNELQVIQINLLLELGRIEEAKSLLALLGDDVSGVAQPRAKIMFYEMAAEAPDYSELESRLLDNPDDYEARYQMAVRQVIVDDEASALNNLLAIVRKDRNFREDGARLLMLKIFDQLGSGHRLVKHYRGRLFGLMH
ncbi:Thioredoxin [invertebrate metagenome]|uniref:Thioredoxin n=1 Tax=invertebrate metagenome TaxID=1711999 RepID=A0A2H9T9X7_9ZZZZ